MPTAPGDHPASLQINPSSGPTVSLPINRRTLIPSAGGEFDTTIIGTVGRQVGQISTFNINVPAGENDLDVSFSTPDASADNPMTFWLVNPAGTVVAEDATPTTTNAAGSPPVANAYLIAPNPVPGQWEIDVELNLTESGLEFTQLVTGNVSFNQVQISATGLPASAGTTLAGGSSNPISVQVTNNANVGRSFTLRASAGDIYRRRRDHGGVHPGRRDRHPDHQPRAEGRVGHRGDRHAVGGQQHLCPQRNADRRNVPVHLHGRLSLAPWLELVLVVPGRRFSPGDHWFY